MKTSLIGRFPAMLLVFLVFSLHSLAQSNGSNLTATGPWTNMKESSIPITGTRYIVPTSYRTVHLDETELELTLDQAPLEFTPQAQAKMVTIDLPLPDGTMETFRILNSPIMEEPLQSQFPDIRTFSGVSTSDPGKTVRFDHTPQGFHAMILVAGESTIFIDPYSFGGGDTQHYIVYERANFVSSASKLMDCSVSSSVTTTPVDPQALSYNSCELREYRLALACTGEYAQFHGGTTAGTLSAQVTTMNRVNGIYERDFAVRMNIIGNNNLLIFLNAGTDPYTNNNGGAMLGENQAEVDATIGSANYDIGHVFSTGGGGIAGLGVVCAGGNKARGVTGSGAPIGDPFDVDYVAHEMGHQFGANHTQNNNCNRNNATAMEPGSASTIMGYAGICAPNVQNNSDDHFHAISMQEIGAELGTHNCELETALTNSAPTITGTNGNVSVPANTPFMLTATATDPDGDVLTYNWEQMDNQVSTQPPVATSTGGPNFRSFSSTTSPTRHFPNLTALANGGPFTWEVLPSVTRTMNFRVTARDNAAGGSCTDYVDVTVDVDGGSGPFIVTYPSATGIVWTGLTSETVTWDVAGTDQAPVSCSNVDILLSTDGGLTYPTVLASNTPNDGTQLISVPNTPTTTARVMVVNSAGTFFDISDNDFEITGATFDYTMTTPNNVATVCSPNDAVYTIDIGEVGGYSDPVTLSVTGLPAGATSSFSVNPVTPVGSSVLTISNIGAVTPGAYTFSVDANSTSGSKSLSMDLNINNGSPAAVTLTAPADAATGVATNTTFTWTASPDNGATYEIDIATDAGFSAIVDQATGLGTNSFVSASLSNLTTYFWRVRVVTGCGTSPYSTTFSFTTSSCNTYTSTNVPVTISASGTPTVTSTLNVSTTGTISDLNVIQLVGNHTYISDLVFTLTSPTGTNVVIMNSVCNNENDFDIAFDDEAAQGYGTIPCPPVGGGVYQPNEALSAFDGEDPNGTWTLTIDDVFNQDGGALTGWALEICTAPPACTDPDVPTVTATAGTYCEGDVVTLNITGNLNDATQWSVYSGSCGGTLIGTTTSSTFDVALAAGTNDYFVRGEGGCVVPGTCGTVSISAGATPTAPTVTVVDNCGSSTLTATGSNLLWSTGETTSSITVTTGGVYTVTQTVGGCTSSNGSGTANPTPIPAAPTVTVVDNCGSSTLTATGSNLLWSTGETTSSITVITGGVYTVTQTVGGCTSSNGSGTANPTPIPAAPTVTVVDNCGSSTLTATGSNLLWSTGETTSSITVTTGGVYTVTQTVGGCTSSNGSGTANPTPIPAAPTVTVVDNCGASTLTATGSNLLWSTGETTSSITVTTGGVYTVTQTVGGCTSSNGSGTASPLPTPTITSGTLTNPSTCGNNDGSIVVNGSGTGTVSWSGTSSGSSGSVSLPYTITGLTAGSYTITFDNGCTSNSLNENLADPSAPSAPTVTVVDNCGSSTLTATGSNLLWSTGETTASITVTTGGVYTVTQTVGGCTSSNGSGTASPLIIPAPTSETAAACGSYTWPANNQTYTTSGNYSVTLTAANGCDSVVNLSLTINNATTSTDVQAACGPFTWIDGNTYTSSTSTPTFTIAGGASNGCDSVVTLDLTITVIDNGVTQLDYNLIEANATVGSYQWIDCDNGNTPIAGATSQQFTATSNGNYAVIITDGACSDTSACVPITTIGTDELENGLFSIYPNPTDGALTVELGELEAKEFTMYDATGRVVMKGSLEKGTNHITIESLARGTYTFEINGYTLVRSIVKL
ncbi:MAG: reprolysin-like metallopeptidase [Fluviicola sp.]